MTPTKRTANNNVLPAIFDAMIKTDWLGGQSYINNNRNIPAVNIKESNDNFIVEVAAPGKAKEDFNIELDNEVFTISAETKVNEHTIAESEKFTRKEFSYNSFRRAFSLPESVNSEQISATYDSGVLIITLPKREEAKVHPKRMIEIS